MMLATKDVSKALSQVPLAPQVLTVLVLLLTVVTCLGGFFIPGLYRFAPKMVTATNGQDLITLALAVPGAALAMRSVRRGSARGSIAWIGLIGYIAYSFIGAAFEYAFNQFFLIYVAGFSLSVFTLITAISSLDLARIKQRFDERVPRRSVATFLCFMALVLSLLWLSMIIPNLSNPSSDIDHYKYIYALDLGMIVPLSLLGAIWLLRRVAWGYLLSGMMLVKAATMGLALLAMQIFNLQAGQPIDAIEMVATYCVIAVGGLSLSVWFLRHCR